MGRVGFAGRWRGRVRIASCLVVEENCKLERLKRIVVKVFLLPELPTSRLDGSPTVLVLAHTTSTKPLVWSCYCSTLATLDSARHDYHTCGCGQNCTAFVGCSTMEHPFPQNAQVPKPVTSTASLPGCKRSLSFSLGLFCLSVCLSVLAPVR